MFSADVTVEDSISRAYRLGAKQDCQEYKAYEFRKEMQKFKETEQIPWPMTSHDFDKPVSTS